MSYGMTQLSGDGQAIALNRGQASYSQHAADETEYDRLRSLARQEQDRRHELIAQSRAAYDAHDGARAKALSNEAKQHETNADNYNKQASNFIFRANNASCDQDTIDLHGLFVEEAEEILETRIAAAQRSGAKGLHIIVGRGNHSVNHVQKLKPAVERMCREKNLEFSTEHNIGRIYVSFDGQGVGEVSSSQHPHAYQNQNQNYGQQQQHQQQQQYGQGQGQYPNQQQQHHNQQQQQYQQQQGGGGGGHSQLEEAAIKIGKQAAPKIFKKLGECCVIM